MFWLILIGSILGGLIGLVILIMIIGRFLPEKYHVQVELSIPHPPEAVWAAMSDYRKHPVTGSMMKRIEDLPPRNGLPVWLEDIGSSRITVSTVVSEPPGHVVREFADSVVPMSARSEVHIDRIETGSHVRATHETWIRAGTWHVPFFRFIMTVTGSARGAVMKYWKKIARDLSTRT
jgi:hypothetical protein